jgi:hypothetical protein
MKTLSRRVQATVQATTTKKAKALTEAQIAKLSPAKRAWITIRKKYSEAQIHKIYSAAGEKARETRLANIKAAKKAEKEKAKTAPVKRAAHSKRAPKATPAKVEIAA